MNDFTDFEQAVDFLKAYMNRPKYELLEKLRNGANFNLTLTYLKKQESGLMYEEIPLEGYKNAKKIFDTYRKIGHTLGLNTITLYLDGVKAKRVKFTY